MLLRILVHTNAINLYVIAFFYREKKTERKKIRKIKHSKIGDFVETSDFFSRKKNRPIL